MRSKAIVAPVPRAAMETAQANPCRDSDLLALFAHRLAVGRGLVFVGDSHTAPGFTGLGDGAGLVAAPPPASTHWARKAKVDSNPTIAPRGTQAVTGSSDRTSS